MTTVRMRCSGLTLEADRAIPGLVPADGEGPADVRIWLQERPAWLDEVRALPTEERYVSSDRDDEGEPLVRIWSGASHWRFLYCDGTEFVVREPGREVWVGWPETTSSLEDATTYLVGPVVGLLLRLRGHTTLHASAVAIDGAGVAFAGPAMAGKSTTAAVFARNGHDVLTDDLVALSESDGAFWVAPGHPVVRLWPNSVSMLFGEDDALPLLTPNWGKRYLDLREERYSFRREPMRLERVYLLGERSEDPRAPYTAPVPMGEALMALIANTYSSYLLDRRMRAGDFELLSRLIRNVPVRRLVARDDGGELERLRQVVLAESRPG